MSWLRTYRNPNGRWDADVSLDGVTASCFNESTEAQAVQGAVEHWERYSFQMAFAPRRGPSFHREPPKTAAIPPAGSRRQAASGGGGLFGPLPPHSNTGGKKP